MPQPLAPLTSGKGVVAPIKAGQGQSHVWAVLSQAPFLDTFFMGEVPNPGFMVDQEWNAVASNALEISHRKYSNDCIYNGINSFQDHLHIRLNLHGRNPSILLLSRPFENLFRHLLLKLIPFKTITFTRLKLAFSRQYQKYIHIWVQLISFKTIVCTVQNWLLSTPFEATASFTLKLKPFKTIWVYG